MQSIRVDIAANTDSRNTHTIVVDKVIPQWNNGGTQGVTRASLFIRITVTDKEHLVVAAHNRGELIHDLSDCRCEICHAVVRTMTTRQRRIQAVQQRAQIRQACHHRVVTRRTREGDDLDSDITTSLIKQSRTSSFHSVQHGTDIGITDTATEIENEAYVEILLTPCFDKGIIVLRYRSIIINIDVQATVDAVAILVSNYIANIKGAIVLNLPIGMSNWSILRHSVVTSSRIQRQRHDSGAALIDIQGTAIECIQFVGESSRCTIG